MTLLHLAGTHLATASGHLGISLALVVGVVGTQPAKSRSDAGSYEALLVPLLDSAYRTALHLTRNAADAEDLVQDAALLASRGFASYEQGSNFKAWFFRILTNAFYSKYRKRKREGVQMELQDTPELYLYCQTAAAGLHTGSENPAALVMDQLDGELIGTAIDALSDDYRVVATLYFIQDFSYQEIAEVLEVPVGTVRSRLHRGRRILQRALWQLAHDRGIVADLTRTRGGEA
jgi:RNA polymerase sigma-70 factor (ECF subfamily)